MQQAQSKYVQQLENKAGVCSSLTDGFMKVGGLSLTSATIMVAVPVLNRPFDAPSKSWIFTLTR